MYNQKQQERNDTFDFRSSKQKTVRMYVHRGSTSTTTSPCLGCLIDCDWVWDLTVPMHISLNWQALCVHIFVGLTCQLRCRSKAPSVTSHRQTFMNGNLLLCTTKRTIIGIVEWCYREVAYHLSVTIMEFKSPATTVVIADLMDHRHSCLRRVTRLSAVQVTNRFLWLQDCLPYK